MTEQPGYTRPEPRRLVRLPDDKMVGGVCSGIAWHLGVDPTLIRVLTAVAGVFGFPVVPLVYLLLWVIVPEGVRTTATG
ncbi:PspC domain-containing protein [Nocardioides terrisoli]|uniref:PspC domain-containing protein n=1 Tax=Nocardioides terrisoli TaxID=3388267 RepID=UPI00287B8D96|nr:PspC domain-containing protein [Nocardioides marmorisolisilvae]